MEEATSPEFDLLGSTLDESFGGEVEEKEEADTGSQAETDSTETEGDNADTTAEGDDQDTQQEEQEQRNDVEDDDLAPKNSKDDIKNAIREMQAESQAFDDMRRSIRDEVRSAIHPEGVKVDTLVDSEGKSITGVSDIAGRLINPATNEVFTWEEAKSWYDNALQEQKDRISSIEQDIDAIAEVNQNLLVGERVVMERYGDMLKVMPEVAKEAFDGFQRMLNYNKSGIVESVKMDVVEYYDMVMRPYVAVARQESLKAEGERQAQAQAEAQKAQADAKLAQADRADLAPNSNSGQEVKKDALDQAFDNYLKS